MADPVENNNKIQNLAAAVPKEDEMGLLDAAPGLVRLAASSWWRAATWVVDTAVDTSTKAVKAAMKGESPAQIAQETAEDLRSMALRALGLSDGRDAASREQAKQCSEQELRDRGAALLNRSADVRFTEDMHPAYERILGEIAPDEARILRYLAMNGAQPTVDVRTARPFGVGSELIAQGLSMIGEESGCRHLDRTSAYMNNLFRLGLVWFSKEKVEPNRYQVVEVQPVVVGAIKRAGRSASTVHRSVHLTPFGEDFCKICLPLDDPGFTLPADGGGVS